MLRLPNKKAITAYLISSLRLTLIFCLTYGFSNWYAGQHSHTYKFWMDWELGIPFVPWTILIYFSLNILMLLPLLTLESAEIRRLGQAMMTATLCATLIFLIFPAHIGFVRETEFEFWGPIYRRLFLVDNTANTFPSLHIAFSFLIVSAIALVQPALRMFLWPWFVAISFSVLLTHQHHVVDIVGGLLLGEFCLRRHFFASTQWTASDCITAVELSP